MTDTPQEEEEHEPLFGSHIREVIKIIKESIAELQKSWYNRQKEQKMEYTPEQKSVIVALENGQYRWRTIEGITKDTGLSTGDVLKQFAQLTDVLIVCSRLTPDNRLLYSTRAKYRRTTSWYTKLVGALTNRIW